MKPPIIPFELIFAQLTPAKMLQEIERTLRQLRAWLIGDPAAPPLPDYIWRVGEAGLMLAIDEGEKFRAEILTRNPELRKVTAN